MAVDRTAEKEATLASLTVGSEINHDTRNWGSTRCCTICNDKMAAKQSFSSPCFNSDISESLGQVMIKLVWRESIEAMLIRADKLEAIQGDSRGNMNVLGHDIIGQLHNATSNLR